MIFSLPWAWLGLMSVPVLVAIYFLRQKARRRTVSSLLLWRRAAPRSAGGRKLERFEGSSLFWLELLILLLLVLAAASPRIATPETRRPLVVVLDNSFSLRAGGEDSPLARGRRALRAELESERPLRVTLILAGARPKVLGRGAMAPEQAAISLASWRATASSAALTEAVALAFELGGARARILVLSDQGPDEETLDPRLAWWSFGRPRSNLALTQAVRSGAGGGTGGAQEEVGGQRGSCLVEVVNFSDQPVEAKLQIGIGDSEASFRSLSLDAEGSTRLRFAVPHMQAVTMDLQVADRAVDDLAFDDRAILLPEIARPVRVQLAVREPALRRWIDDSLRATGRARRVSERAQLLVTDSALATGRAESGEARPWSVEIRAGSGIQPYVGPFVIDRTHPLSEGVSLQGVIWGAGDAAAIESPGWPVISAGDVALLTDLERADGGRDLLLRLAPKLSTLQRTPDWPILWWNLLNWRAASAPGLRHANLRLGQPATWTATPGADAVRWRRPDGGESTVAVVDGRLEVMAETPGVHQLRPDVAGEQETQMFAVNVLAPSESDLRGAVSGRWGDWRPTDSGRSWGYRSVGWILLLLALALFLVHLSWTGTP